MLLLDHVPGMMPSLSPAEIQAIVERYSAWSGKLAAAGKLVSGQKLTDDGGKLLTKPNGKLSVTDGPYIETKELVGGYFVLKADSYEEAVKLAADCPHLDWGKVSVRQIDFMGHPET
jgi:hypothetical protein